MTNETSSNVASDIPGRSGGDGVLLGISNGVVYLAQAQAVVSGEVGTRFARRNHSGYRRDADPAALERRLAAETFWIQTDPTELDVRWQIRGKL